MLTFKSNTRRTLAATLGVCLCPALLAYAAAPKHHTAPRKHTAPSLPVLPVKPAAPSPAAAPGDTLIYNGQPPAQAGVTLANWGGGDVADSTEQAFAAGGHALKVTTPGPYQGARITFNTPADLGDLTDKSRFFQVTVRVAEQPAPEAPGQFPGQGPGGFPGRGFPGGGFPGGGFPGGGPGGGGPVGQAPSGQPTLRLAQYPGAGGGLAVVDQGVAGRGGRR
ncbi:MAG: hypothetical protein JO250_05820, partial [Armatimonadetes bacterium]|nr:hypothetical protein [Armatimonadota bacterium]